MKKTAFFILACALGSFVIAQSDKPTDTASAAPNEHKIVNAGELQWSDAPPALPPGAKMAVLDGDPGKPGHFTVRMKAPAGYKIPPHTHPTDEHVTVLSGNFRIGMGDKIEEASTKELSPGGYVSLPAGMKHYAMAVDESVVQIDSTGPFQINYVNPADDPRNAKK